MDRRVESGRDETASAGAGAGVGAGEDAGQGAADRTAETDAVYLYIRSEIQFELGLINARVNWLVTSQAFLFVPLTLGASESGIAGSSLYPLIPLLGVIICVLVLVALLAAVWRSHQWRVKARQGGYTGEGQDTTFTIVQPNTPLIPIMGYIGALGVPLVLVIAWTGILIAPPGG
ncbi:MAG: hypothetical protein AAF968_11625 [Pseudomonadota bacterium]